MQKWIGLVLLVCSAAGAVEKSTPLTFCAAVLGEDYRLCSINYTLAAKSSRQWLIADGGSGELQILTGDVNVTSEVIERDADGNVLVNIRNKSNQSVSGLLEIEVH